MNRQTETRRESDVEGQERGEMEEEIIGNRWKELDYDPIIWLSLHSLPIFISSDPSGPG